MTTTHPGDLSDTDLADEIIAAAKAYMYEHHPSNRKWEVVKDRLVYALNEHDRRSNSE